MEYVVDVDYGKTASALFAERTLKNEDFPFFKPSINGTGIISRKFSLAFYHDLPAVPGQIVDDFQEESGWGADHIEILTFFSNHPEVAEQFGITVGLGVHVKCVPDQCHEIYPAVYMKDGSLRACKAITFDDGELSDSYVFLMVSEVV